MSKLIASLASKPWRLWVSQVRTIVRMEQRKNFLSRRGFWIYLLAFAPTAIIAVHAFVDRSSRMQDDTQVFAGIFQFYYLRLAIFFGCLGIFTRLIRGEMVERSLHYYLLAPVRREVLVIGKFIAGTFTAIWFFAVAVGCSFAFMYVSHGPAGFQYVFEGPGLGQLESYLGVTVLACIGYGAVFLALSMWFRNPIVPAILLLGWETINPILPSLMQRFSVIFYLRHLVPVGVPAEGIFALLTVVTEPVPAWVATVGVVCVTMAVLTFACLRSRKLEINYTTD